MQPIDLNPHDLDIVRAILQKFVPDREVWAFGSRVKWTAKPFSDLDLAIVGDQSLPVNVVADLAEAFDESELPIKVDVVDWATTSESFRNIIQKDRVVVQEQIKGSAVLPAPTFPKNNTGLSTSSVEWQIVPLEDCMAAIIDYRGKTPRKTNSGIPLVTAKVIKSGRIEEPNEFIDEADFDEWMSRGLPCPGDVVFTTEAPLGEVAQLDTRKVALAQRVITLRGKHGLLDNSFLKFLLQSDYVSEQIHGRASGTTVLGIRQSELRQVLLPLPKHSEQVAIGSILKSLDDKIELNRRMNSTLESMAQTIFKTWFVDFDPVRVKAAGREPFGLGAAIAALFPSTFADSELGEIPLGWIPTTLADIVAERTCKVGNGAEHVVLSAVSSGELKRSAEHFTKQVHSQDTSKYKRVEQWDYAYNPSRINIGSIGMLEKPIVGAVSPVYTVLRLAQGYEWFLRFFLDLPQTKEVINQFCSGSVRQSLSFKDFAAIPVVLPPKKIAEAFARRWQELDALRQHLEVESTKLAEIRDTLLPKLMSGELRVPDELMA